MHSSFSYLLDAYPLTESRLPEGKAPSLAEVLEAKSSPMSLFRPDWLLVSSPFSDYKDHLLVLSRRVISDYKVQLPLLVLR
jgi:hypothetical protein